MPELPEVETVKLQLSRTLLGFKLDKCEVRNVKTLIGDENLICGKKVVGTRRIAKVLLVDFEDEMTVAFHFKMSGQLVFVQHDKSKIKDRIVGGHPTKDFTGLLPSSHTRVVFKFDKGTLYFNDQRKFGWIRIGKRKEIDEMKIIKEMGPEPFGLSVSQFADRVHRAKKRPIKSVIMDQSIVSGVGNIYANDALWEAGIRPDFPVVKLTTNKLNLLLEKIKLVLGEGIKYGGATAADAKYTDLHGLGGHYQDHFRVYDREGEKCLRADGGIIKKITLGGRGTYFCPKCQK